MNHLGDYDVIVIGAGHAGIEAAHAAATLGAKTAVFTMSLDAIGNMPCNPSIGGTAKGTLVRELDALGGVMGLAADATYLQSRMLNKGKGPAVHALRVQTDRKRYHEYMKHALELTPGLAIHQAEIISIEAITKELNGVSRTTVENYIQYLESANLIYQSWPVDMAGKKVLKARPKIYIADAAIRNAVLMDDSVLTDPVEMGKIVETAVYKHVAAFYYQYATSVGYFRGGKKGKEIDIVVDYPNTKNILIEVKYREGAPIADDDAIVELCEESSAAIIITKNADDYGVHNTKCGKDLLRIPAFAFLYLLGNAEKHGYRGMEQ